VAGAALADRCPFERELGRGGDGYIALGMIEPSAALADLEGRYQREAFSGLTYEQALARLAGS
jgi:hypothetical protein